MPPEDEEKEKKRPVQTAVNTAKKDIFNEKPINPYQPYSYAAQYVADAHEKKRQETEKENTSESPSATTENEQITEVKELTNEEFQTLLTNFMDGPSEQTEGQDAIKEEDIIPFIMAIAGSEERYEMFQQELTKKLNANQINPNSDAQIEIGKAIHANLEMFLYTIGKYGEETKTDVRKQLGLLQGKYNQNLAQTNALIERTKTLKINELQTYFSENADALASIKDLSDPTAQRKLMRFLKDAGIETQIAFETNASEDPPYTADLQSQPPIIRWNTAHAKDPYSVYDLIETAICTNNPDFDIQPGEIIGMLPEIVSPDVAEGHEQTPPTEEKEKDGWDIMSLLPEWLPSVANMMGFNPQLIAAGVSMLFGQMGEWLKENSAGLVAKLPFGIGDSLQGLFNEASLANDSSPENQNNIRSEIEQTGNDMTSNTTNAITYQPIRSIENTQNPSQNA